MSQILTLAAPDGTHAVTLGREFQQWTMGPTALTIPEDVRDRGLAFMADATTTEKKIPRDVLWLWVRALRAAWRRAPKCYVGLWHKRPDGLEESTEAYLTDGKTAWMVEAIPEGLSVSKLTPAQAADRQKRQKALFLKADATAAAGWAKAGRMTPEEFTPLIGDAPLRLEHVTPGQHFAGELAALEALVLHLEATALPAAVCTAT